mmetsp:Transcript_92983/g.248872  ORF Transcript_92983/g.248872 Transcript_92983/m.248872 type:complete len:140 (+) Transcript_92983:58-477(+)
MGDFHLMVARRLRPKKAPALGAGAETSSSICGTAGAPVLGGLDWRWWTVLGGCWRRGAAEGQQHFGGSGSWAWCSSGAAAAVLSGGQEVLFACGFRMQGTGGDGGLWNECHSATACLPGWFPLDSCTKVEAKAGPSTWS